MSIQVIQQLQQAYQSPTAAERQHLLCLIEKEYFDMLYLIALSYLNESRADDALQDTFIKINEKYMVINEALCAKQKELKNIEQLSAFLRKYLIKLLKNVIIDNYLRKRKHLEVIDEKFDECFVSEENNIDVWDAVDTLEDASKKIIQFKFHAGWSDDRIADELGISSKVVRRRLKESLALLKARLAA
jgi:RNA polymerase sigma factor (sigma-70 family)